MWILLVILGLFFISFYQMFYNYLSEQQRENIVMSGLFFISLGFLIKTLTIFSKFI